MTMKKIKPQQAYFIKLGQGGKYEQECLAAPGTLRVGWEEIDHLLCTDGKWEAVRDDHIKIYHYTAQVASSQTNQLRTFYETGEHTLWITFYDNHLYWCFARQGVALQADHSRTRATTNGWSRCDINGKDLDVSRLSGSLLAVQGFQSVLCRVHEFDYLVRKINGESSQTEQKALAARKDLVDSLVAIIRTLDWKEFELLTDLIFRQAGWQRLGVLGKATKSIDLDLLSPITNERIRVQVKSAAGKAEYQSFLDLAAANQEFARHYFVVHQPDPALEKQADNPLVKVWLAEEIARLVVNYGLVDWLIGKAK